MKTTVAAIQMVSTPNVDENIATARRLIADAAARGARLVTLPEYWPIMGMTDTDKVARAEQPGHGPIQDFLAGQAREHGIWLIADEMPPAPVPAVTMPLTPAFANAVTASPPACW